MWGILLYLFTPKKVQNEAKSNLVQAAKKAVSGSDASSKQSNNGQNTNQNGKGNNTNK